jgi:hypothetical protein
MRPINQVSGVWRSGVWVEARPLDRVSGTAHPRTDKALDDVTSPARSVGRAATHTPLRHTPPPRDSGRGYSTVTLFARLRGWSTSVPR